jgi:hypothetical protein
MSETYELTASDGRRFCIGMPSAITPAPKSVASVFAGPNGHGGYPLVGSVNHAFTAWDARNNQLGIFSTASDALVAILKTLPWSDT